MKLIRTLFILLLFAIPLIATAQEDVVEQWYDNGIGWYAFFDDVDSTLDVASYKSEWFDWSHVDGQTVYMTYRATSDANDTIKVIIQGRYNDSLTINLDTNACVCNVGVTQVALTPTAYMPMVRFYIYNQNTTGGLAADAKELYLFIYAKALDAVPYYRHWGNANP